MIFGLWLWWLRKRRAGRTGDFPGNVPESAPWSLIRTLNWSATAATALGIVVLSHLPSDVVSLGSRDNSAHILAYGILTLLLLCALGDRGKLLGLMVAVNRRMGWIKISVVVVVVALFGAANELIQPFFNRQGSLQDFLSNLKGSVGVAVLWVVAGLLWRASRGQAERPSLHPGEGVHS